MFGDEMGKGPVLRREVGLLNVTGIYRAVI